MTSTRIIAAAQLVFAATAIAIGALALSPAAQAETFEHSCTTNPGAYATNAVRGEYSTQRIGQDRYEICKVYDAGNRLLGTTNVPNYGYYNSPKHNRLDQAQVPGVLK